jgi:TIR domain
LLAVGGAQVAPRVLFNGKLDIYHVIQGQRDKLKREYEALPDENAMDEVVIRNLKDKYMLDVPTLKRDEWEAEQGPNETVVFVPFMGDPDLFDVRPSQFDGQVAVGEISGMHLLVRVGNVAVEANAKRELDKVDTRLRSLRGSLEYLKQELNIEAAECRMRRTKSIEHKASTREPLTIPVRKPPVAATPPTAPTPVPSLRRPPPAKIAPQTWDVFMSHATPDKPYVKPLVEALKAADVSVWYDNDVLDWGDGARRGINKGLINCRYAIVVLSKAFLAERKWTEHELNGLFAREEIGKLIILPIWHEVEREDILNYDPELADRLAKISKTDTYPDIVNSVLKKLGRAPAENTPVPIEASISKVGGTVAHVLYYAPNGERPHMIVKRAAGKDDWFVLHHVDGKVEEGTRSGIAIKYALADKQLTMNGYKRQTVSGGGEFPEFNL